ncbi:hypothetical protein IFR08_16835 [Pseudomonas fluorescens]|uniref:Uncharacterized protein n=1 Tax=Pseudomonas fluorescens TaxID=294 RepID=A0A2N1DVT0_PSEFL|nr:hypothetical protein [Pseudomonas fluorescens]MBD8099379.1 hypothetical protein [Pseudomonas fluorescens]MBD8775410.1 hypothetical protein [Pseudomonas fluorescens]MBD8781488.1 hypothetical protein [Pseudomonas fluorescens]MBD8794590.1 hypothetical protein [Pseudomonas fluorescens]PKH13749.1 hypothetical protein CIB54_25055 [Pseudomonas fluorescens]
MDALIDDLGGPRTAQQELFYDLEDAGAVIGWSMVELTALAAGGSAGNQAALLTKVCALLAIQQKRLEAYAHEVKEQRINRAEAAG